MRKQLLLLLSCLFLIGSQVVAQSVQNIVVPVEEEHLACDAAFQWDFTQAGCPAVQFTDNSSSAPDSTILWEWTFGDGDSSTAQNPLHTYQANGSFFVCLTITTTDTCVSTFCDSVRITCISQIACQAGFQFDTTGTPTISFFDGSTASTGSIISWSWMFGDGGSSVMKNPVHTYSQPGNFIVCLVISTDDNCTSTYCDTVGVTLFTALDNSPNAGRFSVYPVPAVDFLTIDFSLNEAEVYSFAIRDLQGRILKSSTDLAFTAGAQHLDWDVSEIDSGLYYLLISGDEGTVVRKIVIQ